MLTRRQLRAGLVLCLLLLACVRGFAEKIADIHPVAYVTDLAGVIDPATTENINALCSSIDTKTHAQIAVVTVRSLDGQPIENYAVDLFKHLGVGRKKEDRGVLLLVAPQERRYRIEVGYGLEPIINDARAGDIGRQMVPYLRESNYSAAINTGVKRLAEFISSGVAPVTEPAKQSRRFPLGLIVIAVFGVFLLIGSIVDRVRSAVHGGRRPRSGGGNWWIGPMGGGFGGGGFGGGGWGGGGFGGSSGGFGGFGGGESGGGGASGSW